MIKCYFFRGTNKGGGGGKGIRHKSKLESIANLFQRRLVWLSGDGDKIFEYKTDVKKDVVEAPCHRLLEYMGNDSDVDYESDEEERVFDVLEAGVIDL